jgi:phosphatidylserine decarboxylase
MQKIGDPMRGRLALIFRTPVERIPMVNDAFRFIIPVLALGILFAFLGFFFLAFLFLALAIFISFFFRNPDRRIPDGKNLIVAPADGKVVKISQSDDGSQTISIFLSIFNVHVTRSPISGELKQVQYVRGRFKVAFDDEASRVNEQNIITIAGEGFPVVVKQIAGLIARRVLCWKKPGHVLARGELMGLIRFGSRVDVIVPQKVRVLAKVGDRVQGGSSILGDYL